ncbi:MAG TPA: hypothetical protein DCX92_11215 [Bacteroidetes bacterium]|nr:hypothetical protein [Bacteroidota bacterium]
MAGKKNHKAIMIRGTHWANPDLAVLQKHKIQTPLLAGFLLYHIDSMTLVHRINKFVLLY